MKIVYKLLYSVCFVLSIGLLAQNYDRIWGTYLGPAGANGVFTFKEGFNGNNGNLRFANGVMYNNNYSTAYYNQFTTSGTGFVSGNNKNVLLSSLSPTGTLVSSHYNIADDITYPEVSSDTNGNSYSLQYKQAGILGNATPGTWMPTPITGTGNVMLIKYSANSVMQWKTYLPTSSSNDLGVLFAQDSDGNIYFAGRTLQQNNFTTPNVFVENFEILPGPSTMPQYNNYIVKLNPNGGLLWATYFPADIFRIRYYDGSLYVLGANDKNPNGSVMASAGAFQTQKAYSSITKLNANTGGRTWGTYYGVPIASVTGFYSQLVSSMEVDGNGIFIKGDSWADNAPDNSYFGTVGSHQSTNAGNGDIFLSKFSHEGGRLWSTYFGSPGEEISSYTPQTMALLGNDIIITLSQFTNGSNNLATPGAFVSTMPTTTNYNGGVNLLFAQFNQDGVLDWSSYYGGVSDFTSYLNEISVTSPNPNTFYLYGFSSSDVGIVTPNATQTLKIPNENTMYVARFDKKTGMGTTETTGNNEISLYDNPNNGNFSLVGTLLLQKNLQLKLYDASGRLVITRKLNNEKKQTFEFQNLLSKGNYLIEISDNKTTIKTFKMVVK
ncbi:MAG: T9SS type A sorting domain-containing protein [Bacteroidetes bacterium]|nr:T9SS type A sorting domain-containing protein [Bacteroidota bacterium]